MQCYMLLIRRIASLWRWNWLRVPSSAPLAEQLDAALASLQNANTQIEQLSRELDFNRDHVLRLQREKEALTQEEASLRKKAGELQFLVNQMRRKLSDLEETNDSPLPIYETVDGDLRD